MTPFLLYIVRAGLYLSLFHIFYLLVMRRTTFFRLNRLLLLSGSHLCLLLPFIRLRTATTAVGIASKPIMTGVGAEPMQMAHEPSVAWQDVVLALYIAGFVITLLLYLRSAWKMQQIIRKGKSSRLDGCRLAILEQDVPSFSWRRTVVISRKDLLENPAILTHELMHIKCRHSLDLVLFLPIQLLFWWNPLIWITREELRLLQEYEADEGVIQKGIDATQYQLLLVRKAVGEQRFFLASGFQHTKLKKRIEMMIKTSSSRWMGWSYLALIPVMAVLMYACNSPKKSQESAPETQVQEAPAPPEQEAMDFEKVDVKPTFDGDFNLWIKNNLKYPEQAKADKVQGRVIVQFTIGTDGTVSDVKLLRGVHEDLNAEALRMVSSMPKWEPGKKDGKAVPVSFTIPIVFRLQ